MAFTGNWLRSAQQVQANPTQLKQPSERHGADASDQYPQDHQAPVGADYGDTDFMRTVVQTPGMPLDAPDARSHDSRAVGGAFRNQLERQMLQKKGHEGDDRGWVRSNYAGKQPFQDDTTRYLEDRWEGGGTTTPAPEAIQRGINSLPQNNDTSIEGYGGRGWRAGFNRFRFIDRKNRIDPRVYTPQQLLAREIKVPAQQPAQNGTWGRTSPFASMARNLSTVAQSPELFRNPPGLTDSVMADQAPAAGDGGIATDGMWSV
jgi:hypothetical protein